VPVELNLLRRRDLHVAGALARSRARSMVHGRACEVKAVVDVPQLRSTWPATAATHPRAPPLAALLLVVDPRRRLRGGA
jgi:hypothetical protein